MAEAAQPNAELLEWAKKDKRRFLHAVYRVGDLDRTIKFYTEAFGMKLLRKRDVPEEKYANAFLGFGPETSNFVVELTYNYGVTSYDIGTGFGHFAIATPDVYKFVEDVRAKGGKVTREPGPVSGGTSVIAFVADPDGYLFEILQRASTPEPLCQVMLRVGDLERSIKFYEKALGLKLVRTVDRPQYPKNIYSFNELVALWEKKIGKTVEKTFLPEDKLLKDIQEAPIPINVVLSIHHSVFVKGDHTNFVIEPSFGVEAYELYPDVKYTTVEEYLDQFV